MANCGTITIQGAVGPGDGDGTDGRPGGLSDQSVMVLMAGAGVLGLGASQRFLAR